jgi:hypothetical protein
MTDPVLYARYEPEWDRMMLCSRDEFGAIEYRPVSVETEPVAWIEENDLAVLSRMKDTAWACRIAALRHSPAKGYVAVYLAKDLKK